MGIKKLTPTSAARRYQTYLTRDELTLGAVPEVSARAEEAYLGTQQRWSYHGATSWRRSQAFLPDRRLQARQGRRARTRYADRIRSESFRAHRADHLDGEKRYIIAPTGLEVGKTIMSGAEADILPGNTLPLINIPLGTQIHNIELRPGKGGQMARSAGTFAQLVAKEGEYAQLRMPSGEVRRVPLVCRATVGQVGNIEHENVSLGKAGRSRWKGLRPKVRGVAMNPVDHPHGGGEGKTSGGRNPVTPWGQPTRGYKTRSNKRKMILKDRRTNDPEGVGE